VNKSFVKFVTDFGPLLVFFFFYYNNDKNLKIAIPPFIIATLIALIIVWLLEKKIPMVPLISGILISLFGGLTIYYDNPVFIYIKPTIINILFGFALLFGKYFTKEPILKKIMGKTIFLSNIGSIKQKVDVIFLCLGIN
jgi:intracellular septation protein